MPSRSSRTCSCVPSVFEPSESAHAALAPPGALRDVSFVSALRWRRVVHLVRRQVEHHVLAVDDAERRGLARLLADVEDGEARDHAMVWRRQRWATWRDRLRREEEVRRGVLARPAREPGAPTPRAGAPRPRSRLGHRCRRRAARADPCTAVGRAPSSAARARSRGATAAARPVRRPTPGADARVARALELRSACSRGRPRALRAWRVDGRGGAAPSTASSGRRRRSTTSSRRWGCRSPTPCSAASTATCSRTGRRARARRSRCSAPTPTPASRRASSATSTTRWARSRRRAASTSSAAAPLSRSTTISSPTCWPRRPPAPEPARRARARRRRRRCGCARAAAGPLSRARRSGRCAPPPKRNARWRAARRAASSRRRRSTPRRVARTPSSG